MIAYFWISDTIESIEASVSHKKMSDWIEVRPCQGPGCFKASLSYGPTVKQLAALVDASEECYQDIEVKSLRFYEYGTHIHVLRSWSTLEYEGNFVRKRTKFHVQSLRITFFCVRKQSDS